MNSLGYSMDERVARLKTSTDARRFAENARVRGHFDLASEALQRASDLRAIEDGYITPAQQAIAAALYAYEEQQAQTKGQSFRAIRTRQMIAKRGAIETAIHLVMNPRPSSGFAVLDEAGLQALTFEAIIDRFQDEFPPHAVAAARARLTGKTQPTGAPMSQHGSADHIALPPLVHFIDSDARSLLTGFEDPNTWFLVRWMPRYRETVDAISHALKNDRPEDLFDLIWKQPDNSISHAGQGLLKYETVDRMRDDLIQVIRDIHQDGTPSNFRRIVERFEAWRIDGRAHMVPRLLISRAFAGIHPQTYHTTVDAKSQNQVMKWFVEHTGLLMPRATDWASRAHALTSHLDSLGTFGENTLARNIFPWFIVDQLRARVTPQAIPPGHSPRPASAFADLPLSQRAIQLRHNVVQTMLFAKLVEEFGEGMVWTEYPTGTGGYADALARLPNGRAVLYEIKIADSATQVVRLAMGQLMEYGFRVGGLEPVRIVVVGEPELDEGTCKFLVRLRDEFKLPIEYLQVTVPDDLELVQLTYAI